METAVAQKTEVKKKSPLVSEALAEISSSLENELRSSAGMPLFLQRTPNSSAGHLLDLKDETRSANHIEDAALTIGQPNDVYEQQADHIAQQATQHIPIIPLQVSAQTPSSIQRKPSAERESSSTSTKAGLLQSSQPGKPLSTKVRERVEPLLGQDLSHVQVHADTSAQESARRIQAKAFTHRNHIWLGENQDPDDVGLMSHEATHVVQQEGTEVAQHGTSEHSPLPTSTVPSIQRQFASSSGDSGSSATSVIPASFTPATGEINSSITDTLATSASSPNQSIDPSLLAAGALSTPQADSSQGSNAQTTNAAPDNTPSTASNQAGDNPNPTVDNNAAGDTASPQVLDLTTTPPIPPSGIEALGTGDIALIDEELAEHQRWQGALGRVGTAGSLGRAEFLAESAGGGLLNGFASGAAMGLGIGLAGRALKFVPYVGAIIGGGMALHGLAHRDWSNTAETIGNIGQGNSTYEVIANTLAAVAEAIDVVSNIMNVVAGITGVLAVACTVAAAALTAAAFITLGATLPAAVMAGEAAVTLGEITLAISEVTNVMDIINSAILQPSILLFRALHTFTTAADPREVEAQGAGLGQAASTAGAFFGARVGGRLAEGYQTPGQDPLPHPEGSIHPETPPVGSGDGPVVHFEAPPASADAPSSTAPIIPIEAPAPHIDSAPVTPVETPVAQSTPVAPVDFPTSASNAPTATTSETSASPHSGQLTLFGEPSSTQTSVSHSHAEAPSSSTAPTQPVAENPQLSLPFPGSVHENPGIWTTEPPKPGFEQFDPQKILRPDTVIGDQPAQPLQSSSHSNEASFASLNPEIAALNQSEFAKSLDYQPPSAPTAPPGTNFENAHKSGAQGFRNDFPSNNAGNPMPEGTQAQHWTKKIESEAANLHPDLMNENMSALQSERPGQKGTPNEDRPAQTLLTDPNGGGTTYSTDGDTQTGGNIRRPRRRGDRGFQKGTPVKQTEHKFADRALIPAEAARILSGSDPGNTALWSGANARWIMTGEPGPGNWGPQAAPLGQATQSTGSISTPMSSSPVSSTPEIAVTASATPAIAPVEVNVPVTTTDIPQTSVTPSNSISSLPPDTATTSLPATTPVAITPTQTPSTPEAVTNPQPITSIPVISSEQSVTSAPIVSLSVEPPVSQTATTSVNPTPSTTTPITPTTPGAGNTSISTTPTSGVRTPPPVVPSTLRQIGTMFLPQVFEPGGETMTLAQRQAAHRAQFTADNQPSQGVERVSPQYSNPPGTPQQLAAIQLEIENLLAARAMAEQASQQMSQQEAHHQAQQHPIRQAVQDAGAALSASQAHQQAVARHEQTNQAQQQRQQEAQTLVSGYPSRAAGIAVLTVPLTIFRGFTSLGSHLPGSAGQKMSQMNQDSQRLQSDFAQMAVNMATQSDAQPARQQELQNDAARLQATNQQTTTTQENFQTAQSGAQNMQQSNETTLAQAQAARTEADNQQSDLTQAADRKQQQAQMLSQELQAWASAHKAARQAAINETQKRLRRQGYIV
jgi:Domain of unknown function (DUF4157)